MPNSKPSTPQEHYKKPSIDPQTLSLMLGVFTRFAQLFGEYACQRAGTLIFANPHYEQQGIHTKTFYLWCRKCNGVNIKQIAYAMDRLEALIGEYYHTNNGRKMPPPSYAEFLGLCHEYWEYAKLHNRPPVVRKIENKTAREQRRQHSLERLAKLKEELFGDDNG